MCRRYSTMYLGLTHIFCIGNSLAIQCGFSTPWNISDFKQTFMYLALSQMVAISDLSNNLTWFAGLISDDSNPTPTCTQGGAGSRVFYMLGTKCLEWTSSCIAIPTHLTFVSTLKVPKALNEIKRKIILRAPSEIWQPWHAFFGNPESQISPAFFNICGIFLFSGLPIHFQFSKNLVLATLKLKIPKFI